MALSPIFHGRVDQGGKLVLFDTERTQRRAYLRTLTDREVEVIVRKKRNQRTKNQNAFIHAVPIPLLAEYFGSDLDETKRDLMGECWGWVFNEKLGREVPIRAHTSEMSDEECSFFIDWVIPWAMSKHGVEIPYPNEVVF